MVIYLSWSQSSLSEAHAGEQYALETVKYTSHNIFSYVYTEASMSSLAWTLEN